MWAILKHGFSESLGGPLSLCGVFGFGLNFLFKSIMRHCGDDFLTKRLYMPLILLCNDFTYQRSCSGSSKHNSSGILIQKPKSKDGSLLQHIPFCQLLLVDVFVLQQQPRSIWSTFRISWFACLNCIFINMVVIPNFLQS